MILSIERVLKLLSEGKSADKIAELGDVSIDDVYTMIDEARQMLMKTDKEKMRKKVIIKKPHSSEVKDDIFEGSEITTVPIESSLVMYTDGACSGNPGPAGIGIVIYDTDGRQVGKVSHFIGNGTNNYAEYTAIIRALKIAIYFKTRVLKIRTDSELIVKQLTGEYEIKNEKIKGLYSEVMKLKQKINNFKIEHVTRSLNDKADYLAKKSISLD
ncbi:MAG TPA: ribonuclease HI family protein [Spirochaetota bacterium]|nr:ribonuclease HI family protein [Spirochaetota bacterium]HPJ37501.1 ribonuclease HI family protein [Spirochaetota bacterium]HPQ51690.1 ribonuclease HI family protein [Spirochaetota bacterium]